MSNITKVFAREVLDSRGNPTVQADVFSERGFGRATAPSGASTGIHEALELRDGSLPLEDCASRTANRSAAQQNTLCSVRAHSSRKLESGGGARYGGKGVLKAVGNVNSRIAKALIGRDASSQEDIDYAMIELDGTENKSSLGANATTAVSLAVAQCAAAEARVGLYRLISGKKKILPAPMMNVLNGGKHAANGVAIQEFMFFPLDFPSFSEALRAGAEIYHSLGRLITAKYGKGTTGLGDEGGFAPPCRETREALDLLVSAIDDCGYAGKVKLAIDAAASSFYVPEGKKYEIDGKKVSAGELSDIWVTLCKGYPIASLEDPFEEDSFSEFASLRKKLAGKVQLVADDLFVTNVSRIQVGIKKKSASALLLKVNQIGTLTEALEASALCLKNGMGTVVSHRSGETEDTTIADIAVGIGCGQIKTGSLARAERTCKYNRLLQIEEEIGAKAFARDSGICR